MKRSAILALLVAFVALPLFAQVPTGTLTGHVTDGTVRLKSVGEVNLPDALVLEEGR